MNILNYKLMTREYEGKLLVFLYEEIPTNPLNVADTIDVIFLNKYCDENFEVEYGYHRFDLKISDIKDIHNIEDSVYYYSFISQDYEVDGSAERTDLEEVIEQLEKDVPDIKIIFNKYDKEMFLF